jgi:Ca2+-binding EF-hand superfamily protein
MHLVLKLGLLLGVAAGAGAQVRPPAPDEAKAAGGGRASADAHSERQSRELFAACDADSDDRLDVFEAAEALESLRDPKNHEAFARIDVDRDGFVSWPEFDRHFRAIVERGNSFRVRTCRRLVQQAPEQQPAQPLTPLQRFLRFHDANQDGGLDPGEVETMVRKAGLLPSLGSQLRGLDLDQSGRIEETELAPYFEILRAVLPLPKDAPAAAASLPAPWGAIDANGDGTIDADELAAALRRIDPQLARWAAEILRAADRNRDGKLEAAELPGTGTASATGTAATTAQASFGAAARR